MQGADLLQFVFSGVTAGAIYSLVALGFGVVHNTMGIVNFTQVDFISLGGMFLHTCLFRLGLPMAGALPLAVAGVGLAGLAVETAGLRSARTRNHTVLIFITIGLSIILRGGMMLIWGKNRLAIPPLAGEEPIRVLGATILPQAVWILLFTAAAILLLSLFFRHTNLGLAMRGVEANEDAARVVGLRVEWIKAASFVIAGLLGGLAGVLVTPITTLSYDVGVLLGLKGFAAAILGGFGSFPGAVVGGLGLGLLESLGAAFLSSAYKDATAFILLVTVLVVRPRGLLGRKG
jgi:branched-chain amino acid transport system permease protein